MLEYLTVKWVEYMAKIFWRNRRADFGMYLSITAYGFLAFFKLWIGFNSQSEALMADGLNNLTDIVASSAVLVGIIISRKPRDEDHPYGHQKAETIASLFASFVMAFIALEVLKDAVLTLREGYHTAPDPSAAWMAAIGAVVMLGVYVFNSHLAEKVQSQALMAISKDNLSDALVSVGALLGIIGAHFQMPWLDPLAAIVVGGIIAKTSWDIFSESAHRLTDGFQAKKLDDYRETIVSVGGVHQVEDLQARMLGNQIIVDATITVAPDLNVVESHHITEKVEKIMRKTYGVEVVHIHIEPSEDALF